MKKVKKELTKIGQCAIINTTKIVGIEVADV